MKQVSELVREDLKEVDPVNASPAIRELAMRSRSVLGYKLMQRIVVQPKTLREVLKALNISPFSTKSVELYKSKKLAEARTKLRRDKNIQHEAEWRTTNIANYTLPIPESVLLKAIQIKEGLPEVRMFIDELKVGKIAPPDPFLLVRHDNQSFYVDVWDEPAFEDAILRGSHIIKEGDFDEADD